MFGSTGALLGSLLFSVVIPMLILAVLKVFGASRLDWLAGVAFLIALPVGAVTGLLALARFVTTKIMKQPASPGGTNL
jgi:NAD/NADP transhydrogenase alpha subunit